MHHPPSRGDRRSQLPNSGRRAEVRPSTVPCQSGRISHFRVRGDDSPSSLYSGSKYQQHPAGSHRSRPERSAKQVRAGDDVAFLVWYHHRKGRISNNHHSAGGVRGVRSGVQLSSMGRASTWPGVGIPAGHVEVTVGDVTIIRFHHRRGGTCSMSGPASVFVSVFVHVFVFVIVFVCVRESKDK